MSTLGVLLTTKTTTNDNCVVITFVVITKVKKRSDTVEWRNSNLIVSVAESLHSDK